MMMMVNRIGVIRALHRNVERVFNPDRKAEGSVNRVPRSEPGNKVVALFYAGTSHDGLMRTVPGSRGKKASN